MPVVSELVQVGQLPTVQPRLDMPRPSRWSIFATMMRKHLFVARKRRRLSTCLWPAIMRLRLGLEPYSSRVSASYMGLGPPTRYSLVCIFLFRVFSSLENPMARSLLLGLTVPLYMVLSVQSALQNAMTEIVTEKESKMKIVQEIYGLTPSLYWLSWAGYFLVVSSVCVLAIYILLALVEPVMAKSNPLLVILLLLTSYMQQLEFAAIGSVFFNKLQTAAALSSVINILCLLAAEGMQGFLRGHPEVPRYVWYAGSLLPTAREPLLRFINGLR